MYVRPLSVQLLHICIIVREEDSIRSAGHLGQRFVRSVSRFLQERQTSSQQVFERKISSPIEPGQ